MSDVATNASGADPEGTDGAIAAAVALLQQAEVVAADTRAGADRYARQREWEADLLVQKARRLLLAAEGKAEAIVATARAHESSAPVQVIDLDALGRTVPPGAPAARSGVGRSELDKMLESAIAHAVTYAFPVDAAR